MISRSSTVWTQGRRVRRTSLKWSKSRNRKPPRSPARVSGGSSTRVADGIAPNMWTCSSALATPSQRGICSEHAQKRIDGVDHVELPNPSPGAAQGRVGRGMRGHHELGRYVIGFLLDRAGDAHTLLAEDGTDLRQNAGPVRDMASEVGPRTDLVHRHDPNFRVELERGPVLHLTVDGASQVDDVTDHAGCGRPAARANALKEHLADQVTLDVDGVRRSVDGCQRVA